MRLFLYLIFLTPLRMPCYRKSRQAQSCRLCANIALPRYSLKGHGKESVRRGYPN